MGVNGRSVAGLGVSEVTQMVANSRPTVTLDVEFDVADSVVPSSGTFAVKLAKRHNGLGITLTGKYLYLFCIWCVCNHTHFGYIYRQ